MNILRTFAAKLGFIEPPSHPNPRPALTYEPGNLSANLTSGKIQSALRAAESGETRDLFALYRDMLYDSHVQGELQKRKLAVLNQPWSIIPNDADEPDAVAAAEAVDEMISHCSNWSDGLVHLLDATVWPLSVCEKIYRPGTETLRYELAKLVPVNPATFCFRPMSVGADVGRLPDEEPWEPDLRLYPVTPDGRVTYSYTAAQPLDPVRHLVHRGHLMAGQRDNYGGPLRGALFWWLMRGLSREWFSRTMERFGTPFIVGRVDASNTSAVEFLETAFSSATKLFGLVVDESTQIELKEIAISGAADAHERFANLCNREISVLIVGQSLSAQAQPTGLGSGVATLQGNVRDDLRQWDQLRLAETLREQLFRPFLEINGFTGEPPRIVWGGDDPAAVTNLADLLVKLSQASLEPGDDALPLLSEKVGFTLQRRAATPAFGAPTPFAADSSFGIRHTSLLRPQAPPDPAAILATAHAKAVGAAMSDAFAPALQILENSTSPQDAEARLAAFFADWRPRQFVTALEKPLQIAAAQGALAGLARASDAPAKSAS